MPADPNARRDKALEGILVEAKKTNKLLEGNNELLKKIERNTRRDVQINPAYFERSADGAGVDGSSRSGSGSESRIADEGTDSSGSGTSVD